MKNNNICSICNQKDISLDYSKLKLRKLNQFINNNRLNKDEIYTMIKKCKCNKNVHRLCILLNIAFNYEIKCPDCNTFYNIKITKTINSIKKCKVIFSLLFLLLIHIILYGGCAVLILFDLDKFEVNDLKKNHKKDLIYMQYFFALVLFLLNTYLIYMTIKSKRNKFSHCYKYYINIEDKNSSNIEDDKYFKPLYGFYKELNKDKLRNIICKRHKAFFYNRIYINKEYQNFIINNNIEYQHLSNGNKEYSMNNNHNNKDNDALLKIKDPKSNIPKNI